MDFIVKLSDEIQDFSGYIEVMQLSKRFDKKECTLQEMIKVENRLVKDLYKMTLQDFLQVISDAANVEEHISTPLLPSNCIRHTWIKRASGIQEMIIEVPKNRWDITYHVTRFEQVGFPRLLFKYLVSGTSVTIKTIAAIKDDGFLKEDTPLYHFPFSHVDTSGHVCMGGNTMPSIKSINQLGTIHNMFFAAPFGDDYGVKTTTGKTLGELFKVLSNNDFNEEWLLNKYMTLSDL